MTHLALIPWLDPHHLIVDFGPWAIIGVCLIIFAETGLLVGFLLPGDTLLIITGLLSFGPNRLIHVDIWWVALAIGVAAFLGGEAGYFIGRKAGPRVFERKETGLFSVANVKRTNAFFERFGGFAVILARFVPVVRTFAPIAAGVGQMNRRKYSLYNAIGALIWAAGLTIGGYLLGYIPPVAHFVTHYIDVILLGAVVVTLIPTIYHYARSTVKARRTNRLSGGLVVPAAETALNPTVFDQKRD
jgi:membrane-associated protein